MGRRVGIYARLSMDRDGTKESPATQEAQCRAYCDQRGWDVVDAYVDRDLSAFRRGVVRPQFERLMADVDAGTVDTVVAFKLDRLTRGGLVGIASILERTTRAGAVLAFVHDHVDTSTALGEGTLGLLASVARQESENISVRIRAAQDRAAQRGQMHRGGSRQFGYTREAEVVPEEATIVREVASRLLLGESLRQVAFDLNRRGVRTSMGNEWRSVTLGRMIRSPRLAGLRVHRGEHFEGSWEPILGRETYHRLLATLSRPFVARKPAHLLTGLVLCGKCGANLKTMGFRMRDGRAFERYQCVKQPGDPACGGVAAAKNSLDRFVMQSVLDFLSNSNLRPIDEERESLEDLEQQIVDDENALLELANARFVARSITEAEFRASRDALVNRTDDAVALAALIRRQREEASNALRPGDREQLQRWWDTATVEQQREGLRHALQRVVVNPAKHRGGNKFDTSRVALVWRWDLYMRAAEAAEADATEGQRDAARLAYLAENERETMASLAEAASTQS